MASGTKRWRGTARRAVSTAGVRAWPVALIASTRLSRSCSELTVAVAMMSDTALTWSADAIFAGEGAFLFDPMTTSFAMWERACCPASLVVDILKQIHDTFGDDVVGHADERLRFN